MSKNKEREEGLSTEGDLGIKDSINSFVNRAKADLIIYYARGEKDHINEDDTKIIRGLIALNHKNNGNKKSVVLMIHTLGGNINAAISLMENLREVFSEQIETFVFQVAKSSGAFIGVSSDDLYMHKGSVLSDFTLDPTLADSKYNAAQSRSLRVAYAGLAGKMDFDYWIPTFAATTKKHATEIPKQELVERAHVKKIVNYRTRTKALAYTHNEIIDHFSANPDIRKIFGYNELLFADY